jgi:hypothetical protein
LGCCQSRSATAGGCSAGDRATVIAKHESWLRDQHHLLRALDELRGCDLVCFCAPLPCHGDLLLWLAGATRDERIAWWRGLAAPDRGTGT